MTEPLFTFLMTASLLSLSFYWMRHSKKAAVCSGSLLGLATLVRPTAALLPFLFVGCGLFQRPSASARSRWIPALFCLAAFGLTLFPWVVRNTRVHGTPVVLSAEGGKVLYSSYQPPAGKYFGRDPDEATDPVKARASKIESEVEKNRFYFREALKTIVRERAQLPRWFLLKALFFWSVFDWETLGGGTYNAATAFLLPLSLAGALLIRRRAPQAGWLLIPCFYFFAVGLLTMGQPRFRLAIEPVLVLLAAFAMMEIFRSVPRPAVAVSWIGGWLALNVTLWVFAAQAKAVGKGIVTAMGIW